jgi:hypothetical protein
MRSGDITGADAPSDVASRTGVVIVDTTYA